MCNGPAHAPQRIGPASAAACAQRAVCSRSIRDGSLQLPKCHVPVTIMIQHHLATHGFTLAAHQSKHTAIQQLDSEAAIRGLAAAPALSCHAGFQLCIAHQHNMAQACMCVAAVARPLTNTIAATVHSGPHLKVAVLPVGRPPQHSSHKGTQLRGLKPPVTCAQALPDAFSAHTAYSE